MRNFFPSFFALSLFLTFTPTWLPGDASVNQTKPIRAKQVSSKLNIKRVESQMTPSSKKVETGLPAPTLVDKFQPFTGKITKNKVRLRLQANYESPALRELNTDDLIVVLGETDDFYAVKPPEDFRGYVFRTYVLDNVVEGDRVNIRIKADKDATILGQLKAGERVDGIVSPSNNKWLEIKLPNTARFYIAKEYVEKVGDAGFKGRLEKKRTSALDLLNATDEMSQEEKQKPFEQMSIAGIQANYEHIINDFPEFPQIVEKAKASLVEIKGAYNAKKLTYLEEQSRVSASAVESNKQLTKELQVHKKQINRLVEEREQNRQLATSSQFQMNGQEKRLTQLPVNMSYWQPQEEQLFNQWSQSSGRPNPQEFYDEQKQQGYILTGIIDSYTRPVKNKPGDYLLLNPVSKLPLAFLYSTVVNLQDLVGHQVTIKVSPRNNNNYAFPAYFVLELE